MHNRGKKDALLAQEERKAVSFENSPLLRSVKASSYHFTRLGKAR